MHEFFGFVERNPVGCFIFGLAILWAGERVVTNLMRLARPVIKCDKPHCNGACDDKPQA
jgi:hypothetical protein